MTSVQSQPVLVQPNQFLLSGYDADISYETTSFNGTPRFALTRQGQTLNFSAEEIITEQTQLGQMVTVNLGGNRQALQTVETLTLLIPAISLPVATKTAPLQTIAIVSRRSPTVKVAGQVQNYMTLCLSGTANQLDF